MPFKIVRNDITRMQCDVIVNTANEYPIVGSGCDHAIYTAAGYDDLLQYRTEKIGYVHEGDVFITPAFGLQAKWIIHAVSPLYIDGNSEEEKKLRSCYQKSLMLALENGAESIAFPLVSTGSFGYPMEEGMRIAVDEINAFLLRHSMLIYLVVFGTRATELGEKLYPGLESYIDRNYERDRKHVEYGSSYPVTPSFENRAPVSYGSNACYNRRPEENKSKFAVSPSAASEPCEAPAAAPEASFDASAARMPEEYSAAMSIDAEPEQNADEDFYEKLHRKLQERMEHMSDTFSEYLMYLITSKGLSNADVYKRAIVDKKVFSKIKNNPDYHPQKITAMCLCIGAQLNLDEARDLLLRAGYALSPCDKTDVIFSYFIENEIYDMIELDIQLEEHGLKCLIS